MIGEVSQRSGISARMLRHYDSIGLVSPSGRTSGGYRQYSAEDVRRLFQVEALRSLGLSLEQVATALDDLSYDPGEVVDRLVERTRERRDREEELLSRLSEVRASEPTAWADVLRTIALLRSLRAADPGVRQRAALTTAPEDGHATEALVQAALSEPELNVAGALFWALARLGDDVVPALADALDSPEPERRHRALDALAKIDTEHARSVVAAAAQHPDPIVRVRATVARGVRGDATAAPGLIALIAEGRDDVAASAVLGKLAVRLDRADEIVDGIREALAGSDGASRHRLTEALAEIPGDAATTLLAELTGDPARQVALTASFILSQRR
ncbi:MerR family transcriptional regulator [Epidermidibacterium keratini]|uniref:MerR family transcriptional regulator n=2 Tax=Epidermidibacterium keratini TaxID=1891644 RepID=A0A7L4YSN3_9ACTN|nr:MerR family transcriptional regulator [Epidermidibacterium keratini]